MELRIQAFDRRYVQSASDAESGDATNEDDEAVGVNRGPEATALLDESATMEHIEVRETEVAYSIVAWSSQHSEYPASELLTLGGCWEAWPNHVTNQYVVLEVKGQQRKCITGVSLGLPGTDAGPEKCRVFFSTESAEGPFREAWKFQVASKDIQRHTEQFLNVLAGAFNDGIDEAWTKVLDVNRDGRLSHSEFVQACNRLRTATETSDPTQSLWSSDLHALFAHLDEDQSGTVRLDDLKRLRTEESSRPEAPWWKLLVESNWGSLKRLQVAGPLKLFSKEEVVVCTGKHHRPAFFCSKGVSGPVMDLSTAFSLEVLEVDPKTIMLRRLAKKHNLTILELEDLHKRFREVDTDASGILEEHEFRELILMLHGALDHADIPLQRLSFFWQQADSDGSGEVDFEEFVVWFKRYSPDVDARKLWMKRSGKAISDFRKGIAERAQQGLSVESRRRPRRTPLVAAPHEAAPEQL